MPVVQDTDNDGLTPPTTRIFGPCSEPLPFAVKADSVRGDRIVSDANSCRTSRKPDGTTMPWWARLAGIASLLVQGNDSEVELPQVASRSLRYRAPRTVRELSMRMAPSATRTTVV